MVSSRMSALIIAVALMAVAAARVTEAQSVPSCAADLAPCANYINDTKPPSSCCDPIRKAVNTEHDCLCNLYNNPDLFATLHINLTQALKLPEYCGIPSNISSCNASAPSSNPSPAVPGGNGGGGAGKIEGLGISSLLLLMASLMLL